MKNTQAPKIVLKVGFPILTLIAGTLIVLKVIGIADISWLLILAIWLAPLTLVIALMLAFLAIVLAIGIVCGVVFLICFSGHCIYTKIKGN